MTTTIHELTLTGPTQGHEAILTAEAMAFVAELTARFRPRVQALLQARAARQALLEAGEALDFLAETASVRAGDWQIGPLPADLLDRRVEITGPVDRKMIINALNSGANVFMADFEDSSCPTWERVVGGQRHLRDAVRGTIRFEDPTRGKVYELAENPAVLEGEPVPAALFDFGLFVFHNAQELVKRGTGPYFYLPKLESHLEARLWNDVFVHAQERLGLPEGTIKATVLIETLPAAFEMDEILYELREHSAGLNCGRWDYIFSVIKALGAQPDRVLPDRGQIGMTQPFMHAYTQLVIKTCHRRGAPAMGGMAAQIPIKRDAAANEAALAKVRADKQREARDGHDGTWVAHPGLVAVAREAFDAVLQGATNQLGKTRDDVHVEAADLLAQPQGTTTEVGVRLNLRVGIQYLAAWLDGNGCVPLYDLMEDAATAEISRAQLWQWVHHGAALLDGRLLTPKLLDALTEQEMRVIEAEVGAERFAAGRYAEARDLFLNLVKAERLADFLTLPAYERVVADGR
jgi:malate synthase